MNGDSDRVDRWKSSGKMKRKVKEINSVLFHTEFVIVDGKAKQNFEQKQKLVDDAPSCSQASCFA